MSAFAELLSQLLLCQLAQPEEGAASRVWSVLHFFHHSERRNSYIYEVYKEEVRAEDVSVGRDQSKCCTLRPLNAVLGQGGGSQGIESVISV